MSENSQQFRSAAFGGFQKQDVLNYIERANKEHADKVEALEKQLADLKAAHAALEGEKTALGGRQESTASQLEETAAALETKAARLAELEAENAAIKARLAALEPDAEAYRKVKDRTAGIELEAHCRAQAVEAAAQERVKSTRTELEQWIIKVRAGYDRMRTDMDATISHAGGELDRVGKALAGISVEFAEHDGALESLLQDFQAVQGPQAPTPLDVNGV